MKFFMLEYKMMSWFIATVMPFILIIASCFFEMTWRIEALLVFLLTVLVVGGYRNCGYRPLLKRTCPIQFLFLEKYEKLLFTKPVIRFLNFYYSLEDSSRNEVNENDIYFFDEEIIQKFYQEQNYDKPYYESDMRFFEERKYIYPIDGAKKTFKVNIAEVEELILGSDDRLVKVVGKITCAITIVGVLFLGIALLLGVEIENSTVSLMKDILHKM